MKRKLLFAAALLLVGGSMLAQPKSFGEPKVFIKASQSLMAPVWSPDGSKIAVTGDNYAGIWVANADGSGLLQVSEANGAGYKMMWSDARNIIATPYTLENNRRMTMVQSINVETASATVLAQPVRDFKRSASLKAARVKAVSPLQIMVDDPFHATSRIASLNKYAGKMVINPAISPDNSKIAFQIAGAGVFVCSSNGDNLVSLGKGAYPAWLPDNTNVIVSRLQDNGDNFTQSDLYCVNTSTGSAVNVTPNSNVIPVTLSVSPDGTKIAFDNDTDGCIYLIDINY
jgi:Tol biopolymer transport system component